ncbi:MAG: alpha/beta fold hydrolase [Nitrospirales bacterium]
MPAYLIVIVLACCLMVGGCSTNPPLPPWVELIYRTPFHTITVNDHRIVYTEIGTGPPVILLHGFGGSMWNWEYQYEALAKHHRVLIPDLLGSGLSDKPPGPYTPKYLLDFFRAFMDALHIPRAVLIGNSMGAGLAMGMAMDYPERVESLILISGFPPNLQESVASRKYQQFMYHRPPLWLAKLGNWIVGRSTTERLLQEIIFRQELITPLVIERSFQNRQRGGLLETLYALLDNIDEWEGQYGKRIDQISQRTLVLWGEHDRVFPPIVGERLKNQLPDAVWQIIPDSGHLPQWEQPEAVNQAIRYFLSEQ